MSVPAHVALFLMLTYLSMRLCIAAPTSPPTEPPMPVVGDRDVVYRITAVTTSCTLSAADVDTADTVIGHLTSEANLIKFVLELPASEKVFKNDKSSMMYKPLSWVRTPGRFGKGLLLLRPEYDVLSLSTLELNVKTMHIKVNVFPTGCVSNLTDIETEILLRALVLNNFQNTSGSTGVQRPRDNVCNLHVTNASGVASFRYFCGKQSDPNYIHCQYLEIDTWMNTLFAVMTLIKVLVILFSPRFVPDTFYRIRHQAQAYRHKFIDNKRATVNIVKTQEIGRYLYRARNILPKSKLKNMESFQQCLNGLEQDKCYRLILKEIRFRVSKQELLAADAAPVGLFKTFYETFIKCQISEREALQECCNANMLKKLPCRQSCTFVRFCQQLMELIMVLLLAVPWLLRAVAYYKFEHGEMETRKNAAANRGLTIEFPGSLTLLLSPLHALFIVVYIILSLELCLCGVAGTFGKKVSETLKFVTRKCFRDMREMDNTDIVGWAVRMCLKPCSSFGIFGIFVGLVIWPILLPVIFIVWAFYMLPTVNITFRLLFDLFYYIVTCVRKRSETPHEGRQHVTGKIYKRLHLEQLRAPESSSAESKKVEQTISRHAQPIIILCSLVSFYSIIFLLVELVSISVEFVVYTMMGIILNAGTILTYLSLIILLALYGNEVFGNVANTFMAFNKKMNQIVFGLTVEKVEDVIYTKEDKQDNVSFRVKTDRCEVLEKPVEFTIDSNGHPSWSTHRLLLFLDKKDQPLIPKNFYFKACTMDYYAAPGELVFRYISAAMEFGAVLLFLIFVLLVVLAFGDSFEISSTNKLFATTLGGFVPLLLRKVVFKSHAVPEIDQNSVHFQVPLTDLIEPYEETWPIVDIDVEAREELEESDDEIDMVVDAS